MKKILLYSVLLFWWCLMFPSSSYITDYSNESSNLDTYSFSINNKTIRFKVLDFLFESK